MIESYTRQELIYFCNECGKRCVDYVPDMSLTKNVGKYFYICPNCNKIYEHNMRELTRRN